MHIVRKRQVPQHARAAANRAIGANGGASGHAHAGSHGGVATHAHVMGDLDQVVELDAILDHGVRQGTPVDAGVGANLHVIANAHGAKLLDLLPARAILGTPRCEPEAIGANDRARMNDATRADHAVLAHGHAGLQPGMRADLRAAFDHAQRTNHGAGIHLGQVVHHGTGMDARGSVGRGRATGTLPELGQTSEIEVRVRRDDAGASGQGLVTQGRRDDHAGRLCRRKLRAVLGAAEKAQGAGGRRLQGRQPLDPQLRVAEQLASELLDDGTQSEYNMPHA